MQVVDFLASVLPPPGHGYYCSVELTTKRKEHRFVETFDELADDIAEFDLAGKETYFALSTFAARGSRVATNSSYLNCLFADIDVGVGKRYTDAREALVGLADFCGKMGFDFPTVVSSGLGVHAYWPFTTPVLSSVWRTFAEAFKRACTQHNFFIDYSVSADLARVLRAPGTHNHKYDPVRKVVVKSEGQAREFEHYARILEPYKEATKVLAAVAFDPLLDNAPDYAKGKSFDTALADIQQHRFATIVNRGNEGCKQIVHYIKHAKEEGMEPLWRGVISVAKFCVDGEQYVRELSALHPYDEERMERKLSEIKGPYGCAAFERTNAGVCDACVHKGKIPNPIVLGKELKSSEHTEVTYVIGTTTIKEEFPAAPKGFRLFKTGVGHEERDAEGNVSVSFISDTPFYATTTYDRDGERFVQFTFVEHDRPKSIVVGLAIATSRDDSIKTFARNGIVVPVGQDAAFRQYLKATIAKAKELPPRLMPTNLGWQHDDSFAYDERLFTKQGEHVVPMPGFDNIASTIGVKGTLDGWRLIVGSIMRLERWELISMMLIGFASPLMKFTGLNGLTFHICSNDSGRGKTLAQRLASSVWGAPDLFRVVPNTSPLAMINRLGMLGSLPLMVDEITHKGRAEAEWFPEFLSQMSDGRGKDRMESQTNSERRNTTTWSSLALMTSNKHMLDYLTAEREHGSEGEVRRLIEVVFDKQLVLDDVTTSLVIDSLPENYGVAGEAYARWLVHNVDTVRSIVKDSYHDVFKNFGASGDERFWIAGCACILAAIRCIGSAGAGIIDIPAGKVARYLYESVHHMRVETRKMKRTAWDILNEFTRRNFGKLVSVSGPIARIAGLEIAETLDRRDLCGRVEKGRTEGKIDYYIAERELKAFCSSLSYGYAEFKRDLATDRSCSIAHTRTNLLAGTKGPNMSLRCIHIQQPIELAISEIIDAANDEKAA